MRYFAIALISAAMLSSMSCQSKKDQLKAPVARVENKEIEKHGDVRVDPYYWLRDRDNPEVIEYLKAENAYTFAMMEDTKNLQEKLFNEFKTRIKQTDMSVPALDNGYYYYSRTEDGKQYPFHCRKKGSADAPEEVMLDLNRLAEGREYCSVSTLKVSPDNQVLAYAVDYVGRRFYDIRFRDLETGADREEVISQVTGNLAWANDGKHLFYSKQHPETLRWHQIWRHELGMDPSKDVMVYQEPDETFYCGVGKSRSRKYILIASQQTLSAEYRYLDADKPLGQFAVIAPRQRGHEYQVDHAGDHFYIRTNLNAKNFRLMRTPVAKTAVENWTEVIPHRDDVFLDGFELFQDFLVIEERKNGLLQIRLRKYSGEDDHYIDFGEPAYVAYTASNYEFDTPVVRYHYASMTTPDSVYDYEVAGRRKTLLKQEEVLGGFDAANYRTERLYAPARDGAKVPVSLVYRQDQFKKDGGNPLLLYAYGSYGYSTDPSFSAYRISLLDRGFVFAIAHVRGGQELGRQWYEDGKLLKKMNTFTDFIDCADYLAEQKYADPARVYAMGGSAGGLLMGAIVNLRPDRWHGIVAHVPFVDVVTTMLDDSIPLTTNEYDEWGNPNEKQYYDYMLSYSPYDQVEAKEYPNMLVTTALQDSQVQYWEPAKWVAKLRAMKTDDNVLLLKTEMEASHGGVTGRDKRYRETAFEYAFLLDLAGVKE